MKQVLVSLLAIFLSCQFSFSQNFDYERNTVIVKIRQDAENTFFKSKEVENLYGIYGNFTVRKEFPDAIRPEKEFNRYGQPTTDISTIYRFVFENDVYVWSIIGRLQKIKDVVYAEPLYKVSLLDVPNDPLALPENANADGAYQYWTRNVRSYEAWDITKGDTAIIIGISDTGTSLNHPDLADNIKINYDDPVDGIDNDNDGYVDNYKGWNFALGNNNAQVPHDCSDNNHGAYVSGIADAVTNNGIGVSGAGYNCKFVPLRIMNDAGVLVNVYQSIVYAANHRFNVVNCSWGSTSYQQMGQDVVDYAVNNYDLLIVAAAGNEGVEGKFYPASFENVLSVAATDINDAKWNNSSYSTTVDVSAPGAMFVSTSENGYATMWGGTSFASPIVAGSAGILRSYFPDLNSLQIAEIIRISADNIDTLNYLVPDSITVVDSTFVEYYDSIHVDSVWNENLSSYDSIAVDSVWNDELGVYEYDTVHNEVFVGGYEYDTAHYEVYFGQYVYDTTYVDASYRVYFNESYAGMLGGGRLNLLNALTLSDENRYSTLMHNAHFDRHDDVMDITGVVTNYLNARSNLRISLSTESQYVSFENSEINLPDMSSMQNDSSCFIRLLVAEDAPKELTIKIILKFESDEFENEQYLDVMVNGGYVDVNSGSLNLTVAGNGRLGYTDVNSEIGHGFYLDDYYELFYDCGIIAGISGSEIYSSVRQVSDFSVVEYPHLVDDTLPGVHAVAKMSDMLDFNSKNIEISLDVYADDDNYIIADYSLVNKGLENIENYYFGLFADWDLYEPAENMTVYDEAGKFLYCRYQGALSLYAGLKLLSTQHAIDYSMPNRAGGDGAIDISDGFSDLEKFYMISNRSVSDAVYDMVQYSGAGPFDIAAGDTVVVGLALFAATSYDEMCDAVNAAREKYSYIHGEEEDGLVEYSSSSISVFPNPATDKLRILGADDDASVLIYNSLGECVYRGTQTEIAIESYKPGMYFVEVVAGENVRSINFIKM